MEVARKEDGSMRPKHKSALVAGAGGPASALTAEITCHSYGSAPTRDPSGDLPSGEVRRALFFEGLSALAIVIAIEAPRTGGIDRCDIALRFRLAEFGDRVT